jgi:hypothetical protein
VARLTGTFACAGCSVCLIRVEADQRPLPHMTEIGGLHELPGTTLLGQLTKLLRRTSEDDLPPFASSSTWP